MNTGKRTGLCQWPNCKDKTDNAYGKYCSFHRKESETANRLKRIKLKKTRSTK